MHSIFIVSNHAESSRILGHFLKDQGYEVSSSSTGRGGLNELLKGNHDLVLCAMELTDISGFDMLKEIQSIDPSIPVILLAERGNTREAMQACWKGVWDYISKPVNPEDLLHSIQEALLTHRQTDNTSSHSFIKGEASSINQVLKDVELVAKTDMTVIISGETGTGKEFLAREIYLNSVRKEHPFVALDCGTLNKGLSGSELFGHVKGAFTGAVSDKKGCFELADKGTLFLDEVGNLAPENQMQLLRVLQEHKVQRLGSEKSIPVDVRVIVASNENLEKMVEDGRFRRDLFYRINEFAIHLPALRDRKEDIPLFANHFLGEANLQLHKSIQGFNQAAMDKMSTHDWPGNLRQLRNEVKRLVLRAENNSEIGLDLLPEEFHDQPVDGSLRSIDQQIKDGSSDGLSAIVKEVEKQSIARALEKSNFNKTEAAKSLDIDRKTLYNKLELYKISSGDKSE